MAAKIEQLKRHIQTGNLELARLDQNNQPVKMQISQLQHQTAQLNRQQQIYQLVSYLSWQQKFEWVNTHRLKGNHLFKTDTPQKALETYLESLIGLDLKNSNHDKITQVKHELQFPILMNMAACFYKLKMYQKGIEICDQILNDPLGKDFQQALYKKAYFLYQLGSFGQAKEIILQLNAKLEKNISQKKVSKNDVKQLFAKIISKTKEQRIMYKRIFFQQEDDLQSTSGSSQIEEPTVLEYHENILKRTILWFKEAFESCYKTKPREYRMKDEQEKRVLLQNKKK